MVSEAGSRDDPGSSLTGALHPCDATSSHAEGGGKETPKSQSLGEGGGDGEAVERKERRRRVPKM